MWLKCSCVRQQTDRSDRYFYTAAMQRPPQIRGVDRTANGILIDFSDGTTALYSESLLFFNRSHAVELMDVAPDEDPSGEVPVRCTMISIERKKKIFTKMLNDFATKADRIQARLHVARHSQSPVAPTLEADVAIYRSLANRAQNDIYALEA